MMESVLADVHLQVMVLHILLVIERTTLLMAKNYKMLLVKYIRHVELIEGSTLLMDTDRQDLAVNSDFFSDGQWEELKNCAELAQTISDGELAMARDGE